MTSPSRILITGGRGLLGSEVAKVFLATGKAAVHAPDRDELDITNDVQVRARLIEWQPDLVINCAAYTRVDDCETQEVEADRINGDAAGTLAGHAAYRGIRIFHISTDYVFDGRGTRPYLESDPPAAPTKLSAYGRTKLHGEQRVLAANEKALVIRTAWLYGKNGPSFPMTMLKLAKDRPELKVVNDQTGSPTYAADLADAIRRLSQTSATGIIHVTNSGTCTWYEFACEILRLAEINTPIHPVNTAEFPRPAKRPAFSVLDTSRYAQLTGHTIRPWNLAIAAFLKELE